MVTSCLNRYFTNLIGFKFARNYINYRDKSKNFYPRCKKIEQSQKLSDTDNKVFGQDKVTKFRTIEISEQIYVRF